MILDFIVENSAVENQVIHEANIVRILEDYGYELPQGRNYRDIARQHMAGTLLDESFDNAFEEFALIRGTFISYLKKTLNPKLCGVNLVWSRTQKEYLQSLIRAFERGYVRCLAEIPTGLGKTHCLGAIAWAYIKTMFEYGLDHEVHIFTSRVAIAGQMVREETELEDQDDPLEMGDIKKWMKDLVPDEKIRLLAGEYGQKQSEIDKDAILTISTYSGLTPRRAERCFRKKIGIGLADESHRITDRVAIILDYIARAIMMGVSATTLGPGRDPFIFWERIFREEIDENDAVYEDFLCYHLSLGEAIKRKELKPVRLIASDIKINASTVGAVPGSSHYLPILKRDEAARVVIRNKDVMCNVLTEVYTGDHPGLQMANTKSIIERRGIIFLDRVEAGLVCEHICNTKVKKAIHAKYGNDVKFEAACVHGKMSDAEFEGIMMRFRNGEITTLISVDKIGEGVDLPSIDLIIPLRILGLGSQWILKQLIGRGLRLDRSNPLADLLIIDLVFQSQNHLLASVFGIFGSATGYSGGLLVAHELYTQVQNKVYDMMNNKFSWDSIWHQLEQKEQEVVPFILDKQSLYEWSGRGGKIHSHMDPAEYFIREITFQERKDVEFALALGKPKDLIGCAIDELSSAEWTDSLKRLRSIVMYDSVHLFAARGFGRFRCGLDMVNFILRQNKKQLTKADMNRFIKLLKENGYPEEGRQRFKSLAFVDRVEFEDLEVSESEPYSSLPKKKSGRRKKRKTSQNLAPQSRGFHSAGSEEIDSSLLSGASKVIDTVTGNEDKELVKYAAKMFGAKVEFSSNYKDLTEGSYWVSHAHVVLHNGKSLSSSIHEAESENIAACKAAIELRELLWSLVERVDGNSPIFGEIRIRQAHYKLLRSILYGYKVDHIEYSTSIDKATGLHVGRASVRGALGLTIKSEPAYCLSEGLAKKYAEIALLMKLGSEFQYDLTISPQEHHTLRPQLFRMLHDKYQREPFFRVSKISWMGVDLVKMCVECGFEDFEFVSISNKLASIGAMKQAIEALSSDGAKESVL
jgi:superfamily II DNA or RNA helicase